MKPPKNIWVPKPMRIYPDALVNYSPTDYIVQPKINGDRAVIFITGDENEFVRPDIQNQVLIFSRHLLYIPPSRCPKIYNTLDANHLPPDTILDGELCIENGQQFLWLFDVIRYDGLPVIHQSIEQRQKYLDRIFGDYIATLPDWTDLIGPDKPCPTLTDLWNNLVADCSPTGKTPDKWEGIVLKRRQSHYPLARSEEYNKTALWLKCRIKG